ncbi:MAG: tRNA epoxyqueuosine(34) reductase QueG [Planctomycetota bacterium]
MNPQKIETCLAELRSLATELGFLDFGIAPAIEASGFHDLIRWIDAGYAAEMDYFQNRLDAYKHPSGVLEGVRSLLVMAYPYPAGAGHAIQSDHGRIARYAWSGEDYHDVIHRHLKQMKRFLAEACPDWNVRGCVDTAPLLERELAQLAGLGWQGKNTLLLNKQHGSYFFLATLLVDAELPYDTPHESAHCGTCTACLDACPTGAFPQAGVLDASKCISYLTIEHRDTIAPELMAQMGDWLFGCDVCQEVCPWNRKRSRNETTAANTRKLDSLDLVELLAADEDWFRAEFRKTPLWRTRLRGLKRNAAIVLANQGCQRALPQLKSLCESEDEMLAQTSKWAVETLLAKAT